MSDEVEPPRDGSLEHLHPELAYKIGLVHGAMASAGYRMQIIETARSLERQMWCWASGRTRPGPIVTRSEPGKSRHTPDEHGWAHACDCDFPGSDPFGRDHPWALFGKLCEDQGLRWGGRFDGQRPSGDLGHAELKT